MKLAPELRTGFDHIVKERTAEHFRRYRIPFFTAIPLDKYHSLAALCTLVQYKKHQEIFREGDVGHTFYIIAYGQVSIQVAKQGVKLEVCKMGPGQYVAQNQQYPVAVVFQTICVRN